MEEREQSGEEGEKVSFCFLCFPGGSVIKNSPANAGDAGSIPGWGRSLEKEMATPRFRLLYLFLIFYF